MRIVTFNVNGLRSIREYYQVSDGWSFDQFLASFTADILCFQETKVNEAARLDRIYALPAQYTGYWAFQRGAKRIGYSGVATLCREAWRPSAYEDGFTGLHEVPEHVVGPPPLFAGASEEELAWLDGEGRCLLTDHGYFCLLNVYFPNDAGEERAEYRRLFYRRVFERARRLLDGGRSVLLVGDFNVTWHPMDHCDYAPVFKEIVQRIGFVAASNLVHRLAMMAPPRTAVQSSDVEVESEEGEGEGEEKGKEIGPQKDDDPRNVLAIKTFYDMEGKELRRWFYQLLHKGTLATRYGLRDVFRQQLHPEAFDKYTCWSTLMSARGTNHGTRLDGVLVAGPLFSPSPDGRTIIETCDVMSKVMGSDHCPVFIDLALVPEPAPVQPVLPRNLSIHHKQRRLSDFFPSRKGTVAEEPPAGMAVERDGSARVAPDATSQAAKRSKKESISRLTDFFPLRPPDTPTLADTSSPAADAAVTPTAPTVAAESSPHWRDLFHKPPPAPPCKGHGEPCKLQTVSKRGPNQGRKFYACPRGVGPKGDPSSRCNHFEWLNRGGGSNKGRPC